MLRFRGLSPGTNAFGVHIIPGNRSIKLSPRRAGKNTVQLQASKTSNNEFRPYRFYRTVIIHKLSKVVRGKSNARNAASPPPRRQYNIIIIIICTRTSDNSLLY